MAWTSPASSTSTFSMVLRQRKACQLALSVFHLGMCCGLWLVTVSQWSLVTVPSIDTPPNTLHHYCSGKSKVQNLSLHMHWFLGFEKSYLRECVKHVNGGDSAEADVHWSLALGSLGLVLQKHRPGLDLSCLTVVCCTHSTVWGAPW